MSRTYVGTVIGAHDQTVTVRVDGGPLQLRASTRVALDAISLIGRRVRFQAALSEHTLCLTSPIFVIQSEYGLKAMGAR